MRQMIERHYKAESLDFATDEHGRAVIILATCTDANEDIELRASIVDVIGFCNALRSHVRLT